jgi:hypothetical protein
LTFNEFIDTIVTWRNERGSRLSPKRLRAAPKTKANPKETGMSKKSASKKHKTAKTKRPKQNQGSKPKTKGMVPRVSSNPFRDGSSYGVGYDILASHKEGLPRQKFVELLAKATGKSTKRAGFDAAVVLSAKDGPTGPRHPSCREGYWVIRENDHVVLRLPAK